jgi:hypothetical protein
MTIYTGTLTGSGEFFGTGVLSGVTENIDQSIAVTLNVTINPDGSFAGTEDQIVTTTVTVTFPGTPPSTTTSTQDTGAQAVSGNVTSPIPIINNSTGNNLQGAAIFSSDLSRVDITETDLVTTAGIGGSLSIGGTLVTNQPPTPPTSSIPGLSPAAAAAATAALTKAFTLTDDPTLAFERARALVENERIDDSTNTDLRDAEYYLIGLRAGYTHDPYETALVVGTPAYEAYKSIATLLGLQSLVQADLGKLNAPAGGTSAAYQGLLDGYSGKADSIVQVHQLNNNIPLPHALAAPQTQAVAQPIDSYTLPAEYDLHANQQTVIQVFQDTIAPNDNIGRIIIDQISAPQTIGDGDNVVIGGAAPVNITSGNGNNLIMTGDGGGTH